ncbi:hypothetical protein QZH41_012950 [Actinostola sp. cb2023]|nr:hypothetical protein QZH41_012950 [Actinostola sp. cb2023]
MGATSFIRSLGVPCSQYIDDRHFGQLVPTQGSGLGWSNMELAEAAIFLAASVLSSLGYFIGLAKSHLSPSHLGKKQSGKNQELNDILKQLHSLLLESNISLNLCYVPSRQNPADAPSRTFSDKDCKLSPAAWLKVEQLFGPHTIDLMALDSNTQPDVNGNPLKHFPPWFTPLSAGVNVFAQVIDGLENAYVFPPFVLVAPPTAAFSTGK